MICIWSGTLKDGGLLCGKEVNIETPFTTDKELRDRFRGFPASKLQNLLDKLLDNELEVMDYM